MSGVCREAFEIRATVGVGEKDALAVNTALGDVVRHSDSNSAGESGHLVIEWARSEDFSLRAMSLRPRSSLRYLWPRDESKGRGTEHHLYLRLSYDSTNTLGRVNTISYSVGSHSVQEGYKYTQNGDVAAKGIGLDGNNPLNQGALIATYSFDNEGNLYSVAYPVADTSSFGSPAATYTFGRDSMDRLNTMTDQNSNILVSGVTYSPANQILSLVTSTFTETSTYNVNLQLKELVTGSYHFKYNFSATQNNGRAQSMTDVASGETVSYLYDTLNRLTQASGSGDSHGSLSQAFTYDGFGNLTQKIGNNAPNNLSINVDPTTNRLTGNGAVYDANGNLTQYTNTLTNMTFTYDGANRLATVSGGDGGGGTAKYSYDGSNQRVYSNITTGGVTTDTEPVGVKNPSTQEAGSKAEPVRGTSGTVSLTGPKGRPKGPKRSA